MMLIFTFVIILIVVFIAKIVSVKILHVFCRHCSNIMSTVVFQWREKSLVMLIFALVIIFVFGFLFVDCCNVATEWVT